MKTINVIDYEYMRNEPQVLPVKITRGFSVDGRDFAIVKSPIYRCWECADVLTGIFIPSRFIAGQYGKAPETAKIAHERAERWLSENSPKIKWHTCESIN